MKHRVPAALLLALTLLVTGGCGAPAANPASSAASGQTVSAPGETPAASAAESSYQSMQAASTRDTEAPLTDEQVLDAYHRAASAYDWFGKGTLPSSGAPVTVDGAVYQRVEYAGIENLEDLKTYLRSLFSEELVTELTDGDRTPARFCEVDGVLYENVEPADDEEETPAQGESTYAVERQSDSAYLVNVTVEMLGDDGESVTGLECSAYPYKLVNGRWVFTDFPPLD